MVQDEERNPVSGGRWFFRTIVTGVIVIVIGWIITEQIFPQFLSQPAPTATSVPTSSMPQPTPTPAETETVEPPSSPPVEPPAPDDKVITEARIETASTDYYIGPDVIRVGANPGFLTVIVTEAGIKVHDDACYVQWQVVNNGKTLSTGDSKCAPPGGFTNQIWPRVKYEVGSVNVIADVVIEDGESRRIEWTYTVR